ncbi:LuxE/PaaK family acyltransferase [Mycolicibacterium llatzerense]|uniref:LuxE/PaaK family acyltransferase n=1 Tax=Mycolicibacterium llatzerense TaxID=280871 RepID=UPI0021B539BE|nr:acyl-protein synthetase [Mycolicibacterium llatzerense]MCT7362776.1 acyl-protein synthetase [Mycolicibacterium llatzerense]
MQLETMLGSAGRALRVPQDAWESNVTSVIRTAVAPHFAGNDFFRAQCDAAGFVPDDIVERADLAKIPLLPVSMFKRQDAHVLLTAGLDEIELEVRSTGTGGIPSVARRDSATISNAVIGITSSYRDFFEISKGAGLFLCPSTAEAPEMGMVKVFNILNGMFDDHAYVVRDYAFDPNEAMEYLQRWQGIMTRHIIGPPFLINRFLRFLEFEGRSLDLDPDSMVIMLGGWKRFNGESISRDEFNGKVQTYLGVPADRVRDMYGLIESNMVAIECEHHRKHVPPWCYVSIRDVTDAGTELAPGQTGAIAILDATNSAYPGYILSDDIGEVDETPCACGRSGQSVHFRRRRQGAELGCCAVSIEKFIESREIVDECRIPVDVQAG